MWKECGEFTVSDSGGVMQNGIHVKQYDFNGYKVLRFKGKKIWVHRLVATAFIPNPENKPQVNHKDGIKSNNSVSNLEWVTAHENVLHAHKTGLIPKTRRKLYKNKMHLYLHFALRDRKIKWKDFYSMCGIKQGAFYRRMINGNGFSQSEIDSMCKSLNLSDMEKHRIFGKVDAANEQT